MPETAAGSARAALGCAEPASFKARNGTPRPLRGRCGAAGLQEPKFQSYAAAGRSFRNR